MNEKAKRGRPQGSETLDRVVANEEVFPPTACPACGSRERDKYRSVTRCDGQGTTPSGRVYDGVELRPTKCLACGQARFDRRYLVRAE
jgi:hypothetical protein